MALLSDQEYYYKLDNIILISLEYLRQVFKNRWKVETEGDDWIEDQEHLIKFVEGVGQNAYKRAQSFQKTCLKTTFVADWDMSLLSVAIQNFGCEKKYEKENVAVRQLKNIRNDLAHNGKNLVTREDYFKNVDKIKSSLQSLGMDDKNIDKIIEKAGVTSSLKALEYMNNLHEKAKQFLKDGQTENAADCLSEAIKVPSLLPVNLGTAYEKRAEYFLSQVKDPLIDQEKCNEALLDVTKAIELHEYSWIAHHLAAQCYRWKNELSHAIIHYEKALAISPAQVKVKADYDSCKVLAGIYNRSDHLNPAMMPVDPEEALTYAGKRIGGKFKQEEFNAFLNVYGKHIKGQDHVIRGQQYFSGSWDVQKDFTEGVKHFAKAAKLKNAEGMYNLGISYYNGYGIKQDVMEALRIFQEVAAMDRNTPGTQTTLKCNVGVASSQHCLGLSYDEGIGVEKNQAMAASWYKKAMENGMGNAANNLGLLYSKGQGMPRDEKMAELCWKQALNLNDVNAAASLLGYYMNQMEPDQALDMLRIGRQMGNSALLNMPDDELNELVAKIKSDRAKIEPGITAFEKANKLDAKGLTFKARATRLLHPGLAEITKIFDRSSVNGEEETWGGKAHELTMETLFIILEKAEQGSVTTFRTYETLATSIELDDLVDSYLEHNERVALEIVNLFYKCVTLELHLCRTQEKLKSIVRKLYEKKCDEKGEDDMKIRLCFAVFNLSGTMKSEDMYAVELLKEGIRRYPDNIHYYDYLANIFGNKRKFEQGRFYAQEGLKLFPDNVDLLWLYAVQFRREKQGRDMGKNFSHLVANYKKFLALAPKDHRKVPEAYYQLSSLCIYECRPDDPESSVQVLIKGLEQIELYFNLGLEAEKDQLPCYLPYGESDQKCFVKNFLKLTREKPVPTTATINDKTKCKISILERKEYLMSPTRKAVIKLHRQDLKKTEKHRMFKNPKSVHTTLRQPVAKRMSKMKSITLQEMNPTEDEIYENRILDLTIMDELSAVYSSIHLIAEDERGDMTRLYVYNVEKNKQTLEKFRPGCRIAIINPYMRVGADCTNGIRNDEPKCIIFLEKIKDMCRFCGEGNASQKCSKCKRPYCSKECQKLDLEELNHELICSLKC